MAQMWVFVVASVGLIAACRSEPAPGAAPMTAASGPSAAGGTIPAGMPLGEIHLVHQVAHDYQIDDDALLQLVAMAHAGNLPLSRLASGEGYRVDAAVADSLLARAGLEGGDELTALNGVPLSEPRVLAKAYPLYRMARALALTVRRKGEILTFNYEIRRTRERRAVRGDRPPPPEPASSAELAAIHDGIKQIDEGHYQIKRAALDKLLENPAALARQARLVPHMHEGKVDGIKVYGIRPTSVLAALGLHNGDVVKSVNGNPVHDPEQALEAYAAVRRANLVLVAIERRGQPGTLEYRIVD